MNIWERAVLWITLLFTYGALGCGVWWLFRSFPLWSQKSRRTYRWFLGGVGICIGLPWFFLYTEAWKRHTWAYTPAHLSLSLLGVAWLLVVFGAGFFAKHVFIPLGWVRCAFYAGRLAKKTFSEDPLGSGLLCGVLAALQHDKMISRDTSFLRQQALRIPLRGAGLVGQTLLAHALEGRPESLQPLLRSIALVDARAFPPWARRIATLWQMAYAGTQEDWSEVYRLGEELGAARNWLTRLWQQVAQCFLQSPAERRSWRLWWAFWWAGRPRGFAPLLQRALQAPEPAQKTSSQKGVQEGIPPVYIELGDSSPQALSASWRKALIFQIAAQRQGKPSPEQARMVIAQWNEVWHHKDLDHFIQARCVTLGLRDTGFHEQFLHQLIKSLRPLAETLSLEELATLSGPCSERLVAEMRERTLAEFEAHCQALRERVDAKRALPLWEEWREWSHQQQSYEALKREGGPAVREVAWPLFHTEITHWAIWLWNERNEFVLGNALFRYLWIEALLMNDEQASGLQERNLRCRWE